jgi:hypothetical protein
MKNPTATPDTPAPAEQLDASRVAVAEKPADGASSAIIAAPTETKTRATPASTWSNPLPSTPERTAAPPRALMPSARAQVTIPSVPSFGPSGKRRSAVAVIALSVITLGVYALIWHARINAEMGYFDTRMHVHPKRSTIPVVVVWLLGVLISLAGAARIVLAVLNVALPFDPGFTVLQGYFLLGGIAVIPYMELLIPFSLVAITMTLERVRILEDRVGRTTDVQLRPSLAVAWLLVPIVGGLILQATVQRRLNRVWELAHTRNRMGRS